MSCGSHKIWDKIWQEKTDTQTTVPKELLPQVKYTSVIVEVHQKLKRIEILVKIRLLMEEEMSCYGLFSQKLRAILIFIE